MVSVEAALKRPSHPAEPTSEGGPPWESDELFASIHTPRRRHWLGMNVSLVVHVVVLSVLLIAPLYVSSDMPEMQDTIRLLIYNPPPPPPPPLPKGIEAAKQFKPEPTTPAVDPVKPEFVAPVEVADATPKDAGVPDFDQAGNPEGSDFGIPEGMEGGVDGGVVGGVLGGVLGGVIGGTGDGPVTDYDQAPRRIKFTQPQYPQEAFVKKIEGTVTLEILIDSLGRVTQARVIKSIPQLDAAAIACVKQWVFTPAIKRGRPVATLAHAPVTFRIY